MNNYKTTNRYEPIILTVLFIIFSLLSAVIMPATDDWKYFTSPNFQPELSQLLPRTGYWRPLDVIYGWFLGLIPQLYPYLNHVLVSFNHVLLIWLLLRITELLSIERKATWVAVIYFAITPAVMATLLSVDSLNQSFSMMWGGFAIYSYLKYKGNKRMLLYFLFSILSLFSKESGIVWIFIAPFLYVFMHLSDRNKIKTIRFVAIRTVFITLLLAGLYFTLRLIISPEGESLGSNNPEDRYHLSIFSFSFIKNIFLLFGSSLTPLDTISLFLIPRNYILVISTVVLGLPFLIFLLIRLFNKLTDKESRNKTLVFIVLIVASASPHLVLRQTAEMHVYPTVFMLALFIAWLQNKMKFSKKHYAFVALFVLGSLISSSRKYISMYNYGRSGVDIALALKEKTKVTPKKVLILIYSGVNEPGYSVFFQDKRWAYYGGAASHFVYNYEYPKESETVHYGNVVQRDSIIREKGSIYNCVWIISKDSVSVINNYSDYEN